MAEKDVCKWCQRDFSTTPNPISSKAGELLKRRTPLSKECRCCHNFQRSDNELSQMSTAKLQDNMRDPAFRDGYMERLHSWEENRRLGRRNRSGGSQSQSKVVAEQSTSLETRQILGYLWPKSLLKKQGVDFQQKKLTSIDHAGKTVRGLIRSDWTLGAIEITQSGARTAKRVREEGIDEDSESGGETLYGAMQNQVRARVAENGNAKSDEVQMKLPSKSSTLEDDFAQILWGGASGGGGGSSSCRDPASGGEDDETDKRARLPKRGRTSASNLPDLSGLGLGTAPTSDTASAAGLQDTQPKPKNKKQATETRELEKGEALLLQTDQVIASLQKPEDIMSVQLQKTKALLEKLRQRLSEDRSRN